MGFFTDFVKDRGLELGIKLPRIDSNKVQQVVSKELLMRVIANLWACEGGHERDDLVGKTEYLIRKLRATREIVQGHGVQTLAIQGIARKILKREEEIHELCGLAADIDEVCDKVRIFYGRSHADLESYPEARKASRRWAKDLEKLKARFIKCAGNGQIAEVDKDLDQNIRETEIMLSAIDKMNELKKERSKLESTKKRYRKELTKSVKKSGTAERVSATTEGRARETYRKELKELRGLDGYLSRANIKMPPALQVFRLDAASLLSQVSEADLRDVKHYNSNLDVAEANRLLKYAKPGSYVIYPKNQGAMDYNALEEADAVNKGARNGKAAGRKYTMSYVDREGLVFEADISIRNGELIIKSNQFDYKKRRLVGSVEHAVYALTGLAGRPVPSGSLAAPSTREILWSSRCTRDLSYLESLEEAHDEARISLMRLPDGHYVTYKYGNDYYLAALTRNSGGMTKRIRLAEEGTALYLTDLDDENGEFVEAGFEAYLMKRCGEDMERHDAVDELRTWIEAPVRFNPSRSKGKASLCSTGDFVITPSDRSRDKEVFTVWMRTYKGRTERREVSIRKGYMFVMGQKGVDPRSYAGRKHEDAILSLLRTQFNLGTYTRIKRRGVENV